MSVFLSLTIGLIHKRSLWGVRDALPDGDGFGITWIHGPQVLIIPPVSATGHAETPVNTEDLMSITLGIRTTMPDALL